MRKGAYYNEIDPYCVEWLRNLIRAGLIPPGDVDDRSIVDVRADDVRDYGQCHFFAGIGGWGYAARLAGWPDDRPLWTGSCPCQPFSQAGKQQGTKDERHLWPEFRRLIAECAPAIVFGEQVASRLGREWLAGVRADLEALGYAVGAADLCAAGVGAPHIRQRLYWMADANSAGSRAERGNVGEMRGIQEAQREPEHGAALLGRSGATGWLADAGGERRDLQSVRLREGRPQQTCVEAARCGATGGLADVDGRHAGAEGLQRCGQHGQQSQDGCISGLGNTDDARSQGRGERSLECAAQLSPWTSGVPLVCTDGKARRVEPGIFPLAHGVPGRVGRLRAYGNAIVPQVAAGFIVASLGRNAGLSVEN